MNLIIAPSSLPFRWKGNQYKILECGIDNRVGYAKVDPPNSDLELELKRRVEQDNGLSVYLGLNYICFAEDYPAALDT